MGNCQAAEAATVVVVHPGNKVERIYWSVSAKEIMNANPGNYVAAVVAAPGGGGSNGPTARQLKLLRPDDTLLIGHVYRLISFEDVLKEFSSKKSVKLAKLFEERGAGEAVKGKKRRSSAVAGDRPVAVTESVAIQKESDNFGPVKAIGGLGMGGSLYRGVVRGGGGQWKPALQSIAES